MVQAIRLTTKMKMALERLYYAKDWKDYVSLKTAWALDDQGLVHLPRLGKQRTASGQFPEYEVTLTAKGKKLCEKYFQKVNRYRNIYLRDQTQN